MNKQKLKSIILGVSLALNFLGSLFIGGALIHSCNASTDGVNASSSLSEPAPRKLYAEASSSPSSLPSSLDVYMIINFDVSSSNFAPKSTLRPKTKNVLTSSDPLHAPSYKGDFWTRNMVEAPVRVSAFASSNGYYLVDPSIYNLYICKFSMPLTEAQRSDTYFTVDLFRQVSSSTFYNYKIDYVCNLADIPSSVDDRVLLFGDRYTSSSVAGSYMPTSLGPVFQSLSDVFYIPQPDTSSSSVPSSDPEYSFTQPFDLVKAPDNFWGYRVLNGSYEASSGGLLSASEITANVWSGALRIGGVPFSLGDSPSMYDAIEFRYFNLYGRSYVDKDGNVVTASSDLFKEVLYLAWVSVLPQGLDAEVASNWLVIGSAVNGLNSDGTSLYIDVHNFNWHDEAYKSFKVLSNPSSFLDNYALIGSLTDNMLNPTLKAMNRSEAMRLALTGTSASIGGGSIVGGGSYADVFALLGSAFSSLTPILSVQILPYLTIGTLLLVPLVVLVIFAILKVLNK